VAKWLVALVAGIGIVTLAACGSGGGHPTAKSVTATPTTSEAPATNAARTHAKKVAAHKSSAKKSTSNKKGSSPQVTVEGISVVPTTTGGGLVVVATVPAGGHAPVTIPSATVDTSPHHNGPTTTVKPYDPNDGIDLSGTPGVTPLQQHLAEQLIRDTIADIAKYKDQSVAFKDGFRTIGDGFTGDEHWVNWAYGEAPDTHILDPLYPESLVYNTRVSPPQLEAAMYSIAPSKKFSDIPAWAQNPLMQWHIHNNLCFEHTSDPLQLVVSAIISPGQACPAGMLQEGLEPMIHVWIVANPCGPFAALSGPAAGQTSDGSPANCDTAHAGVL
jgi:hypothetical protein